MERISQQKQCNPQGVCYIYLYRIIYGQRHTAKLSMNKVWKIHRLKNPNGELFLERCNFFLPKS